MKGILLKLFIMSLSLWAISCGQMELTSIDSGILSLAKVEQVEIDVDQIVREHRKLNKNLIKSYSKVIVAVSKTLNPFRLARLVLSSKTDLQKLLGWADDLLDNINKVNTPLVNSKIAEIRALRNAETDPVLRARYDAILTRLTEEHSATTVNVTSLRLRVQSGIRSVRRAQDWMLGGSIYRALFFLTFGDDILAKIWDLDVTLNYLDINLGRLD